MKNEKNFKQTISEIADRIAGVNEKYDKEKMTLPKGVLTMLNSSISNYADLAIAMNDIMSEIIANEPGMQDLETKSGWNVIFQKLSQLSGKKPGEEIPEVPASDEKAADKKAADEKKLGLPQLQEAFNRINRK